MFASCDLIGRIVKHVVSPITNVLSTSAWKFHTTGVGKHLDGLLWRVEDRVERFKNTEDSIIS